MHVRLGASAVSGLLRALVLAAGWRALCEGELADPAFGAAVVALAWVAGASVSEWHRPRGEDRARAARGSLLGWLRFSLHFCVRSVEAGVGVARLAFARGRSPRPELIQYGLRLPPGAARDLFTATLSLMPGTLAAGVEGGVLAVHVLDDPERTVPRELERLEELVGLALGVPLEAPSA